jgi:hypothetical protein
MKLMAKIRNLTTSPSNGGHGAFLIYFDLARQTYTLMYLASSPDNLGHNPFGHYCGFKSRRGSKGTGEIFRFAR